MNIILPEELVFFGSESTLTRGAPCTKILATLWGTRLCWQKDDAKPDRQKHLSQENTIRIFSVNSLDVSLRGGVPSFCQSSL
jgi:hypothetical protein